MKSGMKVAAIITFYEWVHRSAAHRGAAYKLKSVHYNLNYH